MENERTFEPLDPMTKAWITTRRMACVAGTAAMAALAGTAAAQEGDERPGPPPDGRPALRGGGFALMTALDRNRDGKLDAEEIDLAVASLRKLDRDGDGEISAEELRGPRPPGAGDSDGERPDRPAARRGLPALSRLDRDGDGKISKEEAPERMKERFDQIDTNGDGFIDQAEQEAMLEALRRRGGPGGPGGPRPGGLGDRPDRGAGEGGADRPRRPGPAPERD